MKSDRPNLLVLMSDEHDPHVTRCYGNALVRTPGIDSLAADGARFDAAYCNSPLCVPSRFSFMSGRYAHQANAWDNGSPYPPSVPSIGNYLEAAGYDTYLCGRSHFEGRQGFGKRLLDYSHGTKHVGHGSPDRSPEFRRVGGNSHVSECGVAESTFHTRMDETIADIALRFLEARAGETTDKPWMLYVGLFRPHFPLLCPAEHFDLYADAAFDLPESIDQPIETQHPVVRSVRRYLCNDGALSDATIRTALAAYYGLVTFTDALIAKIVDVARQDENTLVLYTSDHGENGGYHGLWQKHCFYEHSARVPLVMAGASVPAGTVVSENVSLVDILPTLLDAAGQRPDPALPGMSLLPLANGERSSSDARPVFAEYHAWGMERAGYMIKRGYLKLNYYVGHSPEMFDLALDPDEINDVAGDPGYAASRDKLLGDLHTILDPERVDEIARANQRRTGTARYQIPLCYRPEYRS